jgi:hypothetical protein
MAQADSKNSISMPDTTRRRFLTVAAVGSIVGAGSLAAAAMAPNDVPQAVTVPQGADPIYAAIERHRDLAKICDAAWKVRAKCKDFGTLTEAERAHVLKLSDAVTPVRKPKTKKAAKTRAKQKPAKIDRAAVDAKRAKAYSKMESHVCDLSRAASLAMVVFDEDELFLFAVEQLDAMAQRFRANYYAEEFPPE